VCRSPGSTGKCKAWLRDLWLTALINQRCEAPTFPLMEFFSVPPLKNIHADRELLKANEPDWKSV
jgi:hypothetical protein